LLLALEHYAKLTGGFGRYSSLASALTGWLTLRANSGDKIIPEGVADVYAALQPVGSDWANWNTLSKLYNQFYTDTDPRCRVNLASVADHTTRDVLVFGNPTGLASINTFKRTEAWALDPTVTVTALSAFASENFINTEISAQWLLAARMAQPSSPDITWLQGGLEALKLPRQPALDYAGIPYTVTHHNFANDYSLPILDTTAYMVFYGRGLNPFAAGSNPGCPYDKFIPLTIAGQAQAFPRLYSTGQSFKTFPQEINDGSHKNVVIEFTPSVTLTTPLTLTIDTVARGNFEIGVTLDGGSHCLSAGDSQVASIPISGSTVSIQLASVPVGASAHQAYQLVLTGNHGWGVFDWLQLKNADGQVVWEIGARDQHCSEFDNTGFSYPCS
jgi:hypothetical protein